ncbi:MAG: hypothetical protein NXI24_23285 [bacterium]|nr:hypothetical protein [bacterium]
MDEYLIPNNDDSTARRSAFARACHTRLRPALLLLLLAGGAPIFPETEDADSPAVTAAAAPREPNELLEYMTERRVSGPEGEALIVGGVASGYLLDSRKRLIVKVLARHYSAAEPDSVRLVFILYSPYSSELFAPDGEDANITAGYYAGEFRRYLHQECYVKIDYENDDAEEKDAKRRGDVDCYVEHTAEYLSGATLGYTAYSIYGVRLENIPYWNPLAVLALSLTLIGLTLPQMAIYLGLVALLRKSVANDTMGQRLLKVLTPLAIGLGWFFCWLNLVVSVGHFPGILNSMKAWFWLSGIFFALNFIACMWIADHIFFPENNPPRWWVVGLFYIFGPFLIVLGGAAGGAAAGGASASGSGGNSSGSSSRSGGAAGRITGGGGTFAGGGASGSF